MDFRSHNVIGIHELNGKIVYVHNALGTVPPESVDEKTVFSDFIMVDRFSGDFAIHSQSCISYEKEYAILFSDKAGCYYENGRLFLNTFKTRYDMGARFDMSARTFAKIFEITDSVIHEVSPAPLPEVKQFNSQKTYRFGDFVLRMASDFKMECRSADTNALIWTLRLTAYLYTELEVKNGILYFGTAGKGGHFYGVSLADGRIIFDCNTGGTVKIVWWNDYVVIVDRKGDLVLINPTDGSEVKRFHFNKMRAETGFPFLVHGNNIYTVLYEESNPEALHAACVEIDAES